MQQAERKEHKGAVEKRQEHLRGGKPNGYFFENGEQIKSALRYVTENKSQGDTRGALLMLGNEKIDADQFNERTKQVIDKYRLCLA